ncbi:MAG: hypothetical protein RR597_02265 [Christensenella sp.]
MAKQGGSKPLRGILYVLSRVAIVVVIIAIVYVAFFAAKNTMNIDMVAKDALDLRAKVVLVHDEEKADPTLLTGFFTEDFIVSDPVLNGTEYVDFKITNYYQRVSIHPPVVWPWQKTATVKADDIVTDISGRESVEMDAEGNVMQVTEPKKPPAWKNGVYELNMIKIKDKWMVDGMKLLKEAPPEPSASASVSVKPSADVKASPSADAAATAE